MVTFLAGHLNVLSTPSILASARPSTQAPDIHLFLAGSYVRLHQSEKDRMKGNKHILPVSMLIQDGGKFISAHGSTSELKRRLPESEFRLPDLNHLQDSRVAMVYLVGGYILTTDQVLKWCRSRNIEEPTPVSITFLVNRWLRERNIPTRLLAVSFRKTCMYLVVTGRRSDRNATETNFEPLEEDSRARSVKAQMDVEGDVEFVTVPNPYYY